MTTLPDVAGRETATAPLRGKTAIITGSGRGIGRAITEELAGLGANVVINYSRSAQQAEELCRQVEQANGIRAMALQADVTQPADVKRMVEQAVSELGRIDILVNNAGINRDRTLRRMSAEEWREVIDTDLSSCFYVTQLAAGQMTEQGEGGAIVMISSIIGRMGNIGQSNYAAAKAGMIGFAKALAQELARHQITVNTICPGFIETDMLAGVPEQARAAILTRIPLGRFGRPEEVARLVKYLVVDGQWMTGAVLDLNGGQYIPS